MIKKIALFCALLLICVASKAEDTLRERKRSMVSESNTIHLLGIRLIDTYLSPLLYKGIAIRYENDRLRYFTPRNDRLSQQSKVALILGTTTNPTSTASIIYIALNYGWGMHYHFRPGKNLQLLLGGMQDVDIGVKYLARNSNNPVNIDLATNLNLSFILQYKIPAKKRDFLLQASIKIPIMGCMFVPEQGASYYEMFYLGNRENTAHFTFWHNKYGISQLYTFDIPARKSVWRLGITANFLKYEANNQVFKKNDFGFVVGWKHHIYSFAGRKNLPPPDFVAPSF